MGWLEEGTVDRAWADLFKGWTDLGGRRGGGGGVKSTWAACGGRIKVLQYGDRADFVSVEVTGEGCTDLGNEGLSLLHADLAHRCRVRCSRVDMAWDGVPFTPLQALQAVKRGDINSRSVTADPGDPPTWGWQESSSCTLYLGRRKSERLARVYDLRGPTRYEIELKGQHAASAMAFLCGSNPDGWGRIVMSSVRELCDFIDGRADDRPSRCPLLPWWASFVGAVERGEIPKLAPDSYRQAPTAIGKLDGHLQRFCRGLQAGVRAYGAEWLIERINTHARRRWSGADEATVAALLKFRGTGIANVPAREVGPVVPI
jgi:hypothetical protein